MTRHFSVSEMTDSAIAVRYGIDNTPPDDVMPNLLRLMRLLEDVRRACGNRPVIVTSGYRSPPLNQLVRGAFNSAHMRGRAADIKVAGLTPIEVANAIIFADVMFDQLIFEGTWIHVGIAKEGEPPRGQVLTARFDGGGRVTYSLGLPNSIA